MSQFTTETAHTLTKDVANPFAAVVDKRKREGWTNQPVIPAGTRVIVTRTDLSFDFGIDGLKPGMAFRTEIALDRSSWDSDPSKAERDSMPLSRETVNGDVVTVKPAGQYELDNAENARERKFAQAKVDLQKNLIDALSQPIRDFRSIFLQNKDRTGSGMGDAADVLHTLFLQGRVTLDEIESLLVAADARYDAELDTRN